MLEVGDPEYYVAFSLPSIEAVRLVNAPVGVPADVHPAQEPDAAAAAQLAEIGPDQRELPPEMQALTAGTGEQRRDQLRRAGSRRPSTAGDAVSAMAGDAAGRSHCAAGRADLVECAATVAGCSGARERAEAIAS